MRPPIGVAGQAYGFGAADSLLFIPGFRLGTASPLNLTPGPENPMFQFSTTYSIFLHPSGAPRLFFSHT